MDSLQSVDAAALRKLLNPPQFEAATTTEGPLLVFAGAGSGKTRVITYRAAHIVTDKGVAPWRVMCVTFTNKAAGEMRERLGRVLGEKTSRDLWISTFHAAGAKLLRRYHEHVGLSQNFAIYDDADQRAVVNRVIDDLKLDDKITQVRDVLSAIDRAKQDMITPLAMAESAETEHERRVAEIYANYENRMHGSNAVDFGDLLKKLVDLLEGDDFVRAELRARFQYVMIDEFQDTNAAQYRIVRALVGEKKNLCVVGDDDQAIYRWRGADVRNIQYFTRDFPDAKVVKLEQNYRSTGRILRAANAVIAKLGRREKKQLFTENGDGAQLEVVSCRDEREEAGRVAMGVREAVKKGVPKREIAVFYRIHAQSRPIEEAMRTVNIPYVVVGGQRFYERAEVKDVLAYMRLATNPNDDVSFVRVVNVPARGVGKTSLDRLAAHATAKKSSLWKLVASGDYPDDVGAAAKNRLKEFYQLITQLRGTANANVKTPGQLAVEVIERTGYKTMLQADKSHEAEARLENLAELVGSMNDYEKDVEEPSLADYLERVTLNDTEPKGEDGRPADAVSLMTVHSAKGLEYDSVFLTGMEDGMFPYKGTQFGADPEELDEERRLGYVAITRAKRKLSVSFAKFRQIFGTTKVQPVSRFLMEMPEEVLSQSVRPRDAYTPTPKSTGWNNERAAAPVPNTGRVIEYDAVAPAEGKGFYRGMRVKHAKFGIGKVEIVETGSELKLTIYFPALGASKRVLAEFIQPL